MEHKPKEGLDEILQSYKKPGEASLEQAFARAMADGAIRIAPGLGMEASRIVNQISLHIDIYAAGGSTDGTEPDWS